jgi:hypothetical protein
MNAPADAFRCQALAKEIVAELLAAKERHAGEIAVRPVETGDKAHPYRIVADDENDGYTRNGGLSCLHSGAIAHDDRDLTTN